MKNMNKILTVSIMAMMAVSAANAKIVSETMLSSTAGKYSSTNTVESAIADAKAAGTAAQATANAAVPKTTTVNGKALSGNISLSASDVDADVSGAASGVKSTIDNYTINSKKISTNPTLAGSDIKATGYSTSGLTGDVAATDTINQAIGKLENKITSATTTANGAVKSVALASGTNNGTVKLTVDGVATDNIAVKGLKSGAYADAYTLPSATSSAKGGVQLASGSANTTAENVSNKAATQADITTALGANDNGATAKKMYPSVYALDEELTARLDQYKADYISVGDATHPVYFDENGDAKQITSYAGKAATAGTADNAVADGSGNNIVNTYATKAQINNLDGALGTGNVTAANGANVVTEVTQTDGKVTVTHGKAVNAVASTASSGTGNVITGISLNADGKTIDFQKGITALTSADIANKADKATTLSGYGITDAYTKTETGTQITNAINNLDVASVGGSGTVIKAISEANGKISATAGAIGNADIAGDAAIAPSKIATSSSNRFVTDSEKNTWNAKQGALPDLPLVAPTSPDGTYVLTAKKENSVITYAWEDIGR